MKFKNLLLIPFIAISLIACDDDEQNTTDFVQENVERGAILRTVDRIENSIPISIEDGMTVTSENAQLSLLLEEQDVQGGDLLQSVDVYLTFVDGYEDNGDSSTEEVFFRTIDVAEFSEGPFGLPRTTLTITGDEMIDATGIDANILFGGDNFFTRLVLNLTDGRTFSNDNAGGVITGGFFDSPFAYTTPVVCNLETTSFVGEYLIEEITPYVDGPTFDDGSVVTVAVGDTDSERVFDTNNYPNYCTVPNDFKILFICGEIVIPVQESNCACGSGADWFASPDVLANYDAEDDTVFEISFINDAQSNCSSPVVTTYRFTKQ